MPELAAIDIETSGLNFMTDSIIGIGFYSRLGGKYFEANQIEEAKNYLTFLQGQGFRFAAHNQKFDWRFLRRAGVVDHDFNFTFDTKIAIPLLKDRPGSNGLEAAAAYYSKTFPWKDEIAHKNAANEPSKIIADYCLKDCEETLKLTYELIKRLKDEGQHQFYFESLLPLDHLLTRASYRGICLDVQETVRQEAEYKARIEEHYRKFREEYKALIEPFEQLQLQKKLDKYSSDKGREKAKQAPPRINLGAPKQLLTLLKTYAGIDVRDTNGKPSTSDDALFLASDNPVVRDVLKGRELLKPVQFFEQWRQAALVDGKVHTTFNVDIARTGRLTSTEPNMQQIPVRSDPGIRKCFKAQDGRLLVIRDLSQIEPRFIAHYSQDPVLLKVYREGLSLYGQTAVELGLWDGHPNELKASDKTKYAVAKTIVLGILYNMGSRKLSFKLRKDTGADYSVADCRNFIQMFFDKFKGVGALREKATRRAYDRGYLVNFFGRHVFVPREKADMVSLNTLIQSSASDFMCLLQLKQKDLVERLGAKLLLLVHDEEIYEAPVRNAFAVNKLLEETAEAWGRELGIRVPVLTEGGVKVSWGDEVLTEESSDVTTNLQAS